MPVLPRAVERVVAVAIAVLLATATAFAAAGHADPSDRVAATSPVASAPAIAPAAATGDAPQPATAAPPTAPAEAAVAPRTEPVPAPAAPDGPPPTTPPPPRVAITLGVAPFASVAGLALVHPAATVERIGFHESSHDGAQPMGVVATAVSPVVLPSRARHTAAATAADVVVDPHGAIRAPVTGTVKRAGGYILYCRHRDEYVVIAPEAQPHLEVKLLHVRGVQVAPGARVVAGETVVAATPTALPFASQVDEFTADPSWPHVHIEVVDPAVEDRPSPGGGC